MSFLDKFLNVMRLNPDDDDDFYNEDYDYDDEEEEVKPKSSFKKREKEDTFTDDYKEKPVKTTPKVTPIRPSKIMRQTIPIISTVSMCPPGISCRNRIPVRRIVLVQTLHRYRVFTTLTRVMLYSSRLMFYIRTRNIRS